jgi:hypothetical protein
MTPEEMEQLNPPHRWNWRKVKSVIKARAKSLTPHVSYAWGCRGHPGLVIERNYWPGWTHQQLYGADVVIKSLIDGIEESCSIWHCAPMAMSREDAEQRAAEIRVTHDFDLSVKYGHTLEDVKSWHDDWVSRGVLHYVLHDQDGFTVRSTQAFTKEDADKEIERLRFFEPNGITNPRMVDMLTYPVPITSF